MNQTSIVKFNSNGFLTFSWENFSCKIDYTGLEFNRRDADFEEKHQNNLLYEHLHSKLTNYSEKANSKEQSKNIFIYQKNCF